MLFNERDHPIHSPTQWSARTGSIRNGTGRRIRP
jgi:hypothetical protein